MSVLRPPPISAFIYPEAVPGTPQGKTCRATRCQLSSGVPPSPVQPASKPAAPRLHKTVASTRLCQGRSAGKGLARGGEGRLFSRPCNFPRSRLAGPAGVGRGPGPLQGGAARLRRTEVGSGKVRIQPSAFCFPSFFLFFFFFHPLVLFSPTSSLVVGEVWRGRGRQRRGRATSLLTRPAGFGFQRATATRRPGCGSGSREGAERGVRTSARPQFPRQLPFTWRLAILTLALSVCLCKMSASECRVLTLGVFHSLLLLLWILFTNCLRSKGARYVDFGFLLFFVCFLTSRHRHPPPLCYQHIFL